MTDLDVDARSAAFSSLLAAVAGSRRDLASARFDEELAAAEAVGSIDPVVARTLRWWQREALRSMEEHLQSVLPGLLAGLESADHDAAEAVVASAESWAAATGAALGRPIVPPAPDGTDAIPSMPGPPPAGGPAGGGSSPGAGDPTGTPYLRPVDRGPDGGPSAPARLLRPGFAPPQPPRVTPPGDPVAHASPEGGASPRRLLVGGLTVLAGGAIHGAASASTANDRSSTPRDDAPGTPR
jgi:hypothetical protein